MKGWRKTLGIACLLLCGALAAGLFCYLQLAKFGASPQGARLERIESSAHYAQGQFENTLPTPQLVGQQSALSATWKYLFRAKERPAPVEAMPSEKTDLLRLDKNEDVVVWLGHSSYYLQLAGKSFLIDPVLSDAAAPVPFVNRAFPGTRLYAAEELPAIDYLLVSHDHWDHLDYPTVAVLRGKVGTVVCGLGVGAHFERWGFSAERIREADWFETLPLSGGLAVHVLPARHYSGRLLEKNKTLWAGFALTTPERRIFYSGDSGYGPHFKEIGARFGGFDLALLDNGQYDESWPYIHMTPEEAAQAALDLGAKALLPAHVGKFSIANHPWDEPFIRLDAASRGKSYRLLTPKLGERVALGQREQNFSRWWEAAR